MAGPSLEDCTPVVKVYLEGLRSKDEVWLGRGNWLQAVPESSSDTVVVGHAVTLCEFDSNKQEEEVVIDEDAGNFSVLCFSTSGTLIHNTRF